MSLVHVWFRFEGELNEFLPPRQRCVEFAHPAGATDTVKHVIESLGVPHTEIKRITIDGLSALWTQQLATGNRIGVHPHTPPIMLPWPGFVVDGHLGRLAAYLRMLGFDTWYDRYATDDLLASVADRENRLLLTRDIGLLKRREVSIGYCVRSDKPHVQLQQVTHRYALQSHFAPFRRCMDCNGLLQTAPKSDVEHLLPPHTRETKNDFSRCGDCGKVFWRGSHHARMLDWIHALTHS